VGTSGGRPVFLQELFAGKCKKMAAGFDVMEMGLLNRILALGSAAGVALDHIGDLVFTGFARRDMKVIIPVLGVCVLLGSALWLMFRSETVVVVSEPVDRRVTEEIIRRLKSVDGSFEADANDELASIMLAESEITQSGWALISQMKNVRKLVMHKCLVTDSGLHHLLALEDLKVLGLAENPVTDKAVEHLSQLEGLRALDLQGTLITRQGVLRLRAALPGCAIIN
jgi:hypothetical protein